ncbi:copper-binding protein [Photobacterium phosphoreum]|uniref:copper-resistant cuproprotein CopI n=2 Tax=Photobacterium phosphoreum TaxID=659 RepID=UPI000D160AC8|nr:copper-binding protein [Photobacterium phosphoreum]PSU74231.1 copper-binding protein [Photobacterium phosphoreum]PSW17769.1 copper-binding protein [Photobacterium phosphoreum]
MKKTLLILAMALTTTNAIAAMDHSTMDHSGMDHSQMDATEMDHSGMDHSQMDATEMDHSGMDHSQMDHQMMNMKSMSDVGMPAAGSKPDKVAYVILSDDMQITFKQPVDIKPNDVVQFVVINQGKMAHEFSIGSPQEQAQYRKMTKDHQADNGNTVTIAPGKAKQVLWHFHGSNKVELACNMAGHADAGMTKTITL